MPDARNQGGRAPTPAPFAPLNGDNFFELPCGQIAKITDVVALGPNSSTSQIIRYQEEVRLIQRAIGVESDGMIGPDTRTAARDVSTRFTRDVVKETFAALWMEAYRLGIEARDAGMPKAVHDVCAYFHNKLCMAHADLKGEEHLDLTACTKRPVFIKLENLAAPAMQSGDPNVVMEPKVDLGAALQGIEIARMRKVLTAILNDPHASVATIYKLANEGLGHGTAPAKPTDEFPVERWAIEDALKALPHVQVLRPIGLENYLRARLDGARGPYA